MKLIINLLHTIFFYAFLAMSFVVGTCLAATAALFIRDKEKVFQTAARIWAKLLGCVSRISVKVEGLENIPKKRAFVLVSNHQSAADILILLAKLPVYFKFVAKRELFKIPLFGTYLRLAGYIPIDRHRSLKAHKTLYDTSKQLKRGSCILIFPEGTRTRTGKLGPFKRGSLVIARQAEVPILPIAISGSFAIMPKNTFIINPSKVKLTIGEPIPIVQKDIDKTINKVRGKILSMLKKEF